MRRPLAPLRTTAALTLSLTLALTACGADDSDADATKDDTETTSSSAPEENDAADEDVADGDKAKDAAGEGDTDEGSPQGEAPSTDAQAGDELTPEEFAQILATAMERGRTARIKSVMSGATMEGAVDYTRDQPALRMVMAGDPSQGGVETEMIMVDGAAYMQMGTDQYIKMSTEELGDQASRMDPGADLSTFSKGITSLDYLGEEKLDGETTHHYLAVIDTKELGLGNAAGRSEKKKIDYHVWLGTDDLIRKFSMDVGGEVGAMEMTYYDWGKPVEIKAPPKSQVTEMPELPSAPSS